MSSHRLAPRVLRGMGALVAVLCLAFLAPSVRAIDIVFVPTPTGDVGDLPAADMDGAKLAALLAYVETVYEDIIEDPFTITINYQYVANLSFTNGSFATTDTEFANGGGRTTEGLLRIHRTPNDDPAKYFYYDPTPADDSEFDMVQWLYQDLSGLQQTNRFSGSTPDLFEAGYRGDPIPGSPCDDSMCTDLLTILFHEVGHGMGLTSKGGEVGTLLLTETADATFDVNPNFVNGQNMELNVRDTNSTDSLSHVFGATPNNFAIMSFNSPQTRRRPSAADIFAFASVAGWTDIDLRRQDFLGGGAWNTAGNWMGDQTPGSFDEAYVRSGDTVGLSGNATVRTFTLDNNSFVVTLANKLDVVEVATLQSTSTINRSYVWVNLGGEFEADSLVLNSGGDVRMESGLVDVNTLVINADATIYGRGTVDVATSLNNNGSIEATTGSTLTLTTSSVLGIWDLDGTTGNGVVRAVGGDLVVQGGISDAFDGVMVIGVNHFADFDTAWTLGAGGRLELNGNAASVADMRGAEVTVLGDVLVSDRGLISAPAIFGSTANVSILGPNGRLSLTGPTTLLAGGSYTGLEIQFDNTVNVNGNVTLSTTIADLDGNSGNTTINVNTGTFSVNTSFLDDNNNNFDGTINVIFGAKFVPDVDGTSWNLRGTLNLGGVDGLLTLPLAGDDVNVMAGGVISVDGPVKIEATVHLDGGSIQTADATTEVILSTAANTISGGSVDGPGQIGASSGVELRGFGAINAALDFDGTSMLIAENGTLSLSGTLLDVGTLGTNGLTSVLEVNSFWDTNFADQVVLNLGQLTGGLMTNSGLITGQGFIGSVGMRNNGTLSASGAGLSIEVTTVALLDLDGTNNAGVIEAINGSVQVNNDFAAIQTFNGTLTVGAGQEYRMLFDGLDNTGQVTLEGGTYVAPLFEQSGNMTMQTSPSVLESDSVFNPSGVTLIHANLSLVGSTVVEAGAAFSGSATLINTIGSHLQLKNGVLLGVDLQNDGTLEVGDSPGIADVRGIVTLTSTSSIIEEIDGTGLGNYDRIEILETTTLDGALRVIIGPVSIPMPGDFYDIIEADLGITGAFSSVAFPSIANAGMGIQYFPTITRLIVGLIGDLDFDGFVGITDLNIVLGAWNDGVDPGVWGDGDPSGDGFVGIEDLNTVLGNWNAGTPPGDATNIPEPGTLGMLGLLCVIVCRRRGTT
jgi:hypothetical protein